MGFGPTWTIIKLVGKRGIVESIPLGKRLDFMLLLVSSATSAFATVGVQYSRFFAVHICFNENALHLRVEAVRCPPKTVPR